LTIGERFDDAGCSGATLDRPAMARLRQVIEEGGILALSAGVHTGVSGNATGRRGAKASLPGPGKCLLISRTVIQSPDT